MLFEESPVEAIRHVDAVPQRLLKSLQSDLVPQGFSEKDIHVDQKDRNAILVIVPNNLMGFELNKSDLRPEGEAFLRARIPAIAAVLCDPDYRDGIESVLPKLLHAGDEQVAQG